MTAQKNDPELLAIDLVLKALSSLDSDARARVVTYVFQRLGLETTSMPTSPEPAQISKEAQAPGPSATSARFNDVRSLKEAKSPKSVVEMAALVAYY
jgi:hypothetical protein